MTSECVVSGCIDQEAQTFPFPTKKGLREEWMRILKHPKWASHHRVCLKHFRLDAFVPVNNSVNTKGKLKRKKSLKPDAVPCEYLLRNIKCEQEENAPWEPNVVVKTEEEGEQWVPPNTAIKTEKEDSSIEHDIDHPHGGVKLETDSDSGRQFQHKKALKRKRKPSPSEVKTDPVLSKGLCQSCEALSQRIVKLEEENEALKSAFAKIMNEDQVKRLQLGDNNRITWSEKTLQDSFIVREAIGKQSYEYLRSINYPYPHQRTLTRFKYQCSPPNFDPLAAIEHNDSVQCETESPQVPKKLILRLTSDQISEGQFVLPPGLTFIPANKESKP